MQKLSLKITITGALIIFISVNITMGCVFIAKNYHSLFLKKSFL